MICLQALVLAGCARYSGDDLPLPDISSEPDAVDARDGVDTGTDGIVDVPGEPDGSDALDGRDAPDGDDGTDAPDASDAADAAELCGDTVCAPLESCCSSTCTDTMSDFSNCGACGVPCDSAKASECTGGACRCDGAAPCSSGTWMRCCTPDGCVATDFNDSHCGACYRRCSGGTTCSFGICR